MKKSVKLIITISAAVLTAAAISLLVHAQGAKDPISAACDGTFVAGVIFAGIGLLRYIGREGLFDGFSYIGHLILQVFTPIGRRGKKSYHEYKDELRGKHADAAASHAGRLFLICGAALLLISGGLVALHYMQN